MHIAQRQELQQFVRLLLYAVDCRGSRLALFHCSSSPQCWSLCYQLVCHSGSSLLLGTWRFCSLLDPLTHHHLFNPTVALPSYYPIALPYHAQSFRSASPAPQPSFLLQLHNCPDMNFAARQFSELCPSSELATAANTTTLNSTVPHPVSTTTHLTC